MKTGKDLDVCRRKKEMIDKLDSLIKDVTNTDWDYGDESNWNAMRSNLKQVKEYIKNC